MSIEAMKQALEALEELHRTGDTQVFDMCYAPKVIPALRQAIEQTEKQEPVATVVSENKPVTMSWWHEPALPVGTKLYTTPQPAAQNNAFEELAKAVREFAIEQRAIEAKLKEKNT